MVTRSLTVLERALADADWLLGETFSVADLNVAGVLSPSRSALLDMSAYPRLTAWLAACYARPAVRRVRKRYAS